MKIYIIDAYSDGFSELLDQYGIWRKIPRDALIRLSVSQRMEFNDSNVGAFTLKEFQDNVNDGKAGFMSDDRYLILFKGKE